jgi:hypothetical protein
VVEEPVGSELVVAGKGLLGFMIVYPSPTRVERSEWVDGLDKGSAERPSDRVTLEGPLERNALGCAASIHSGIVTLRGSRGVGATTSI